MSQLGRIGGALLAGNLLRNGTDLAFENTLLYLNVNSKYIGINSNGPSSDLTIGTALDNGGTGTSSLRTVNLVATSTNIGNFVIGTNTIQHLTGSITVQPNQSSNPTIVTPGLSTANLYFYGNTLSDTVTNDTVNISPNGTGAINFANDAGSVQVTVNAGLHATGNITWDGNITLGDASTDRITFAAEVNSDILPTVNNSLITPVSQPLTAQDGSVFVANDGVTVLYSNPQAPYYQTTYLWDLGSSSLLWNNLYTRTLTAVSGTPSIVTATNNTIGNFSITGNNISNANNDISYTTTGTGQVKFNTWPYIQGSNIVNPNQLNFNLNSTANGYVKFAGSNGFVLPTGTTSGATNGRPLRPEEGTTRWNSTASYIEIYSSTLGWIPVYGTASNATINDVTDLSTLYTIVFGY
jgi:hypothetical protein